MIKGVNKKVIEINRPDSVYFERAVLYLKPDVTDVPLHAAQMETLDYFDAGQKKQKFPKDFLLFLSGMAVSGMICWIVLQFWQ
ncbi:MAG: hypothetical protein K2H29_12465 [Oscillospiraceae bacterium]|nr:hypothetical protein [Oscillospiraceae bacterium]MDE5885873.1 hypothetical protein [Oscillospiraceae bacterium]MDE6088128.1 hypothetical protein [Oscillospiraceae bacterium]